MSAQTLQDYNFFYSLTCRQILIYISNHSSHIFFSPINTDQIELFYRFVTQYLVKKLVNLHGNIRDISNTQIIQNSFKTKLVNLQLDKKVYIEISIKEV